MLKKFYGVLAICAAALSLFIMLITSFEIICYHVPGYYESEFTKYGVTDELERWTGDSISMDSLVNVMDQTMSYLRGNRQNLIVETDINGEKAEFYNENEKSHMADVRVLFVNSVTFRALSILTVIAIAGFLIVILGMNDACHLLARAYTKLCNIIAVICIAIGALCLINFTAVFTVFHEIFFSQGNWLFDPRTSRMIDILPEGFFSDTAALIAVTFLVAAAVLYVIAAMYNIIWKRHNA